MTGPRADEAFPGPVCPGCGVFREFWCQPCERLRHDVSFPAPSLARDARGVEGGSELFGVERHEAPCAGEDVPAVFDPQAFDAGAGYGRNVARNNHAAGPEQVEQPLRRAAVRPADQGDQKIGHSKPCRGVPGFAITVAEPLQGDLVGHLLESQGFGATGFRTGFPQVCRARCTHGGVARHGGQSVRCDCGCADGAAVEQRGVVRCACGVPREAPGQAEIRRVVCFQAGRAELDAAVSLPVAGADGERPGPSRERVRAFALDAGGNGLDGRRLQGVCRNARRVGQDRQAFFGDAPVGVKRPDAPARPQPARQDQRVAALQKGCPDQPRGEAFGWQEVDREGPAGGYGGG